MFLAVNYVLVGAIPLSENVGCHYFAGAFHKTEIHSRLLVFQCWNHENQKQKGFASDCLGLSWPTSINGNALYPHSAFELILGFYM